MVNVRLGKIRRKPWKYERPQARAGLVLRGGRTAAEKFWVVRLLLKTTSLPSRLSASSCPALRFFFAPGLDFQDRKKREFPSVGG